MICLPTRLAESRMQISAILASVGSTYIKLLNFWSIEVVYLQKNATNCTDVDLSAGGHA